MDESGFGLEQEGKSLTTKERIVLIVLGLIVLGMLIWGMV